MKFIAAVDSNWAIGNKGHLLVRISEDQKNFKNETMGHVVVLGRKTIEEFPGGRPLKGRTNIVLSTNMEYTVPEAIVVHSLDELFDVLSGYESDDVYVIGGQTVYDALIPYCDTGIVTKIDGSYEADAFIPNLDLQDNWTIEDERLGSEKNDIHITFVTYKNDSPLKKI